MSDAHLVVVHLGAPVRARCQIDALDPGSRLQVRGDIDIVPVGSLGFWDDETPTRLLALRLSPDFRGCSEGRIVQTRLVPRLQVRDESLTLLVAAFERELQSGQQDDLFLDGLALAFCGRLSNRFSERAATKEAARLRGCRLRRVQDYIEAHLEHCIRVSDLAGVAGLGISQFTVAFRSSVGLSPHQYVISRRVERAKSTVLASSAPLSEIAVACGFANQSHMSRRMNETLGTTPGRLRRSN